jgi:cell wall-associated NlpC family hydrolase
MEYTEFIGIPFVDGGRDKNGTDCFGLVRMIYHAKYGIMLPEFNISCMDFSRIGNEIENNREYWKEVEPESIVPSLIVFRFMSDYCNHVGVYVGDGKFIHTRQKVGSNVDRVDSIHWKSRIEGYYTPLVKG